MGLPCGAERRCTKNHEGTRRKATLGAGRACAQGARPARGPVGAWRASHAMLWFLGSPPASAPSYMSYTSYASYRDASNQLSFQSANQRARQRPLSYASYRASLGTSQTCRGCRGEWKFGSLDAWKFGFLVVQLFRLSPACRAFCSPWPWKVWPFGPARSVLRSPGRESALPLPGRGAAPHTFPICTLLISQILCVLRVLSDF